MILKVRSNKSSFKEVCFQSGFNVILAERTKESTKKDSRNGLGKTTLLEIIHFCLGSSAKRGHGIMVPELDGWIFIVDMLLADIPVTASRSTTYRG